LNSVLGEVTPERVEIARQADHIFISMIREAGLYDKIAQAFAALDPTKAVGVMVCTYLFNYVLVQLANTNLYSG
jgi:GMP synthase PP-ATPase subunit